MGGASHKSDGPQQVNFTLDAHWRLVLRVVAEADDVSVPDLLRPVVVRYLRRRMRNDDLKEAVARIELMKRARQGVPDNVRPIPAPSRSRGARKDSRIKC
jgi:hypothetical protein